MTRKFKRILRVARRQSRPKSSNNSPGYQGGDISYPLQVFFVVVFIIGCGIAKCSFGGSETDKAFIPPTSSEHKSSEQMQDTTQHENSIDKSKRQGRYNANESARKAQELESGETNDITVKRAEKLVQISVAAYLKTGHPCACPYNLMRNGDLCGRRSAYDRPGGKHPLCFVSDVKAPELTSHDNQASQRRITPHIRPEEQKNNTIKENPFGAIDADLQEDIEKESPLSSDDPWSSK